MLVGQTDDSAVKKAVNKLMRKFPQRVTLEEYAMEDMHKAYDKSHIVLIPTMYAEGTSLSCLEAMATNNALVATNIGGLPNLVVNGYNGSLIEPSTKDLEIAVEELISDRARLKQLAANGREFVEVFEKSRWDEQWKKILKEII
jgi:glycosyltransferase involved in cell wall biosynthesis